MNKKIAIVLAAILAIAPNMNLKAYAEGSETNIAYFADVILEEVIRQELEQPEGDLLVSELSEIKEISAGGLEISSLEGIEQLINLTSLDLRENFIVDLEPLRTLKNLTSLNIRETMVTDLSPLQDLINLEYLNIHSTPITNVAVIGNLQRLETLIMRNVPIGDDVSFLENLKALTRLNVRNTNIKDITVLAKLMEEGVLQDNPQLGIEAELDLRDNPLYVDASSDAYEAIRGIWENITNRHPNDLPGVTDLAAGSEKVIDYEELFIKDNIIDIHVEISEEDWESILGDPMAKEYKSANITVDGINLEDVGLRTKGNSTLRTTANSESERYSFKIKVDRHIEEQTLLGLDKFVLNSNVMDPSNLREYLSYELLRELGADVPLTNFANIYINGELYGFYLMVEAIDDSFIERNFEDNNGSLYKAGQGSSLQHVEDSNYDSLDLKSGYYESKTDLKNFIKVLNEMPEGEKGEIESVLEVDSALRYFAVNTVLGNYDSYHGNRSHNYYLYGQESKFTVLPWDFDLSFAGFSRGDLKTIPIDEPVAQGENLENYPLINNLLAVEEYKERYYEYINESLAYLENFEERVTELTDMIRPYVEVDPSKSYTMEQFEANTTYSETSDEEIIDFMENPMMERENQMQRPQEWEAQGERQMPQEMQMPQDMAERFANGDRIEPPQGEMGENMEDRPQRGPGDNMRGGPGGMMGNSTSIINFVRGRVENIKQQLAGEIPTTGGTIR
ncbi:Spore coat protein CotH [Alkaliphilus metalliredigens QYMF]|uniref:Spore coat protein CotH n=1 Tax=Alkaliphilus metalliredigens (strain QYMF) TaxID=293826 RepID=A6TPP0_ALKMQ|nr:CotH kinase family protein [Alkaliphilus metalliredigens]ABR48158.1 Spore coat protein CotH [Alkaliphilus metalliredigens QYMF]